MDIVLVGDSAAMTVLGYESTVPVGMDEMLMLAAAVRRGLRTPLLIGDMPFGSYERSNEQAVENAQRFIKEAGCDAVKLERGGSSVDRARAIIRAGIPVMGHVGLTPQTATALGGYKAQGQDRRSARSRSPRRRSRCRRSVASRSCSRPSPRRSPRRSCQARGAGDRDRRRRRQPTARCWSSTTCSGSTGATRAKFVKRYAEIHDAMVEGVRAYAADVRARGFPGPEHIYSVDPAGAGGVPRLPRAGEPRGRVLGLVRHGDLTEPLPVHPNGGNRRVHVECKYAC